MDTLTTWTLGRRVERLLFGGAALVAATFVVFYLASAARHYEENRAGVGMENLALLIEGDDKVLQRFYELETQRQKLAQSQKKESGGENFYVKALEDKVARAAALSGADPQSLRALVNESDPPDALVRALRERKRSMDERPATVAGVVVPNGSLGTRVPAAFVANVALIALGPVIIFWLGALRATRIRERIAADEGAEPYPHALNAERLPVEGLVELASRRWPQIDAAALESTLAAFGRMALLAMLVVPMIASYIAAVTTLGAGAEGAWLRALYAVVVIAIMLVQTAALLFGESPPRAAAPAEYDDAEDDYEDEPELRQEPRLRR